MIHILQKSQPGQSAPEGFQQQTDVSVKRETSVVVSGEASESDEEYEIVTNQDVQPDLPPLNGNELGYKDNVICYHTLIICWINKTSVTFDETI